MCRMLLTSIRCHNPYFRASIVLQSHNLKWALAIGHGNKTQFKCEHRIWSLEERQRSEFTEFDSQTSQNTYTCKKWGHFLHCKRQTSKTIHLEGKVNPLMYLIQSAEKQPLTWMTECLHGKRKPSHIPLSNHILVSFNFLLGTWYFQPWLEAPYCSLPSGWTHPVDNSPGSTQISFLTLNRKFACICFNWHSLNLALYFQSVSK